MHPTKIQTTSEMEINERKAKKITDDDEDAWYASLSVVLMHQPPSSIHSTAAGVYIKENTKTHCIRK